MSSTQTRPFATIEEAIEAIRAGHMIVVVDIRRMLVAEMITLGVGVSHARLLSRAV